MAKTTIKNSDGTEEKFSTKSMFWVFVATIAILSAAVGYVASNFAPTFWHFFGLTFLAACVIRVSVKDAVLSAKMVFVDHDWEREDFVYSDPSWLTRMRNYLESVSAPVDTAFKPVTEEEPVEGEAPAHDPATTTDGGTDGEEDDEESDEDPDPAPAPANDNDPSVVVLDGDDEDDEDSPEPVPTTASDPAPTVGLDATDDEEQTEEKPASSGCGELS